MITVVIPFYNSERYLKRAIDSCLTQKEVSQIILIDDCSTDNSNAIAEKASKENASTQIVLFKTVENVGPGPCRNMAMDSVDNPFISFLDSDDFYLKDRFTLSLNELKKNESLDGVYAPFKQQFEKENLTFQKENFQLDLSDGDIIRLDDFLLGETGNVAHWGILFRTSFIKDQKIAYANERTGEDIDFLFDAIIKGKIAYSSKVIGKRCITGDNLTTTADAKEEYQVHHRWFKKMIDQDFSKEVNYYFLKNAIIKKPFFQNKTGFFYKFLKGITMVLLILVNPKLWFKLL